jgi:hypothetical protein
MFDCIECVSGMHPTLGEFRGDRSIGRKLAPWITNMNIYEGALFSACILTNLLCVKAKDVKFEDCSDHFQNKRFAAAKECVDDLIAKGASKPEIEKARFLRANANLQLNEPILSLHDLHDIPVDNEDAIHLKAKVYITIGNFKMATSVLDGRNDSESKNVITCHVIFLNSS